ncbi:MAG: protein kinase [Candidatus Sulfotelmatobacter sp.]|jgi:eukaryotic-like serine/threonine-protein kinase
MGEQIKTPPPTPAADGAADALAGTTVGRFAISKRLGAGGMGQVYSAEDTTLKRFVAIKRMAPDPSSTVADRKRLLKEAQRASALNHPNVGAVYDVVEHGGELWLVMEYVEGETLRRRLKHPISTEEFFTIATQCCEGLQAAHEKGIIHGDIKPENIMITPGNRVKILDFGVARRAWSSKPDDATKSMETMKAAGGTPAYMAPEVLLQKPDDGRSDIFSLGLVFYEMLGGEQPFQSDSLATTVARIVHVEAPPLKNVPGPLAGVISRSMAKDPDARYATASALLEDLHRVQHGGKPKPVPSTTGFFHQYRMLAALAIVVAALAVLFGFRSVRQLFQSSGASNVSQAGGLPQTKILAILPFTAAANADPKLIALGQGLVESVSAKLGKLTEDRAFEVVPASNLQEKKISTLPDAARMFGANLGLVLSLDPQSADLVKVTYLLVSAQNGAPVGSGSLTVPVSDAFSAEQIVADGTVKALHLQLLPEEETALKYHGTDQAAAYEYYLQAQGYLLSHSKAENLDNAALMAREALKLDPNFGMAKAVLGESYWLKYSDTKQKQWIAPAQEGCNDAVKLGNAGAAGHICLGRIDDGTGHSAEAAAEFQLALGLEPTNEEAAIGLAHAYEHDGKITEAEKAYQQAIQSHPNSRFSYNAFGTFYRSRNEYDKALQMYGKVIQIAPDWYGTYVNVGSIYVEMGQNDKAIDPLKKSIAIRPSYPGYVNLGAAYYGLKNFADAASAFEEATKLDPQQYVTWGNLGAARYYSGKKDQSMEPYHKAADLALEELKVNPRDPVVLSALAGYYSMLADRKHALLYLGQALQYGHNDKEILIDAAGVYDQLGETGLAIEWLAKAVQAGYTADKIRGDPEFANLVDTPGFQQLMKSSSR